MKQVILDIAKKMNIENIGFTNILNYDYLEQFLIERVKKDYNNELEENNIKKRLDVRNIFPQCKSIIAVGITYAKGYEKINTLDKGLLSVVSLGEDYHLKVKSMLNQLAQKINDNFKNEYMICVDTSPLIDREICKNAGIGNYGKNSLIINYNYGSFMYLGYILTDLEIEIENENLINENKDICKGCSICINSCPNNAILTDGGINTKRCVSYLTQTKLYIPLEYRKNMKNQIYGCDICQVVCPKNKKILSMESENDYNELFVDLDELLTMNNSQFNCKYGYLSGSWRGKNIWKRNSIISIANLNLITMFDKVQNELKNPSEMIKVYSAWSLMKLNKQKASDLLHSNLKYENDIIKSEYKKLLEGDKL